jgi:hypothetical protein
MTYTNKLRRIRFWLAVIIVGLILGGITAFPLETERRNLTQRQLAVMLDDHQPNMSDLVNGKIAKFRIDKLVRYADRLGIETTVKMVEHKKRQLERA